MNIGAASYKSPLGTRVGGRLRQALANPEIARKAAKAATTRMLNRRAGWAEYGKPPITSPGEDAHLKEGVIGMAERVNASAEQLQRLREMDQSKLSELYRNNRFVFEVVFSYEGIEKNPNGSLSVDPSRLQDIDFLIQEYDRAFGGDFSSVTLLDY